MVKKTNIMDQNKELEEKKEKIVKGILLGLGITAAVVGGVYIYKNRAELSVGFSKLFSTNRVPRQFLEYSNTLNVRSSTEKKNPLDGIVLTGERLTAKEIGDIGGISAKKVNDRLIELGLADRYSVGVRATDVGKKVSEEVVKTTSYNYTFSNCEWDKAIIPMVLTPDEIAKETARKAKTEKIIQEMRKLA